MTELPIDTRGLASALTAQSELADLARTETTAAAAATHALIHVSVEERPGDPPTKNTERERALLHAIQSGAAVSRPGGQRKEHLAFVSDDLTGSAAYTVRPVITLLTPETADAVWAHSRRQRKAEEDKLLISFYGEKQCREAGIL